MTDLRAELLAEIGPNTHVADLCRRAMQDINLKAARVAVLEQTLERLRSDRPYIVGFNDGWNEAISQGATSLKSEVVPFGKMEPKE